MGENWFLHRGIKYNIFGLIPKTCYVTQTLNIKYRGTIEPRAIDEVDDEIHFFIVLLLLDYCLGLSHHTHFLEARKTLFELINKSNVNFQSLSSFQKMFWTFNCENIDILNNLFFSLKKLKKKQP